MIVYQRVTLHIKFTGTLLYTWVERGTVRVKSPAQLETGPFNPESSTLIMKPPHFYKLKKCIYLILSRWVVHMAQLTLWQLWFRQHEVLRPNSYSHLLNINKIQILLFWQKLCHIGVFVSSLNINKLSMSGYKQGSSKATKQPVREDFITAQFQGSCQSE